jgi:DNA repair protein RadA/Sms
MKAHARDRPKVAHRCAECGFSASKWFGRCPDCSAWSTAASDVVDPALVEVRTLDHPAGAIPARLTTGIDEFDRVVGGGLVPGSTVLFAGEPGLGKSTLVVQVVDTQGSTFEP